MLIIVAAGCAPAVENSTPVPMSPAQIDASAPAADPTMPDFEPTGTSVTPTETMREPDLALTAAVPAQLADFVTKSNRELFSQDPEVADYLLAPAASADGPGSLWVYALAGPFATVTDNLSLDELAGIWSGQSDVEVGRTLIMSADTLAAFSAVWGPPEEEIVRIAEKEALLDRAWSDQATLALIPFEEISPRWKVIQVDGMSPLDPGLDIARYPLKIRFEWVQREELPNPDVLPPPELPQTNREPEKFTTLVLTGTTALTRYIAAKMEENGIEYPLGDIAPWLQEADITHISNEVSFYEDCPPALPARRESRFCSHPNYIELLSAAGADVIELTGNHNLDWGVEPYLYSLELYRQYGFQTYGGGENLEKARQPLIVEHGGTKLAFLGCNAAGPESAWAAENSPGAAPCDLDWMAGQVSRLRDQGILPVVTFQHYEVDDYQPMNLTRQHFQRMAEAGAVIVSGSQAHFPHGFAFYNDSFLHYGLGNLFFDQMFPGNRREFLDRHIFYDGRYLGVELLTAMLEDYSRPRPMTAEERAQMLRDYFDASGW